MTSPSLAALLATLIMVAVTPVGSTLAITEVMIDGACVSCQWFELYNFGGNTMNYKGWRVQDGQGHEQVLATSDTYIGPGEYLLVARIKAGIVGQWSLTTLQQAKVIEWTSMDLRNTGDSIDLLDSTYSVRWKVLWKEPQPSPQRAVYLSYDTPFCPLTFNAWEFRFRLKDLSANGGTTRLTGYESNDFVEDASAYNSTLLSVGSPLLGSYTHCTQTPTPTPTATETVTGSRTPTRTPSQTPTGTRTVTHSRTTTDTPTDTPSPTSSPTGTRTYTDTRTTTLTPSHTPTPSPTTTGTRTDTSSPSSTPTSTLTVLPTHTDTTTSTPSPTLSSSPTTTTTPTRTATFSFTETQTATPTSTHSETHTVTRSSTGTSTITGTPTPTSTHSDTQTRTGACLTHTDTCHWCDNGVPCNDNNPLTIDDKCLNGMCVGVVMKDILESPEGKRHFEVRISVVRDDPSIPISNIVWAVYDYHLQPRPNFLMAGEVPTGGLHVLAEEGHTALLLEELKREKAKGRINQAGVVKALSGRQTTPWSIAQEASFHVTAHANEILVFACMLVRTNDRYIAPRPGAIPFFRGLKPNYGDIKPVPGHRVLDLWDVGTELEQPYWANLHEGQQSNQPGGGQPPLPWPPRSGQWGRIQRVNPLEYHRMADRAKVNDTYPDPDEFMRVTLFPALDAVLKPSVRAQRGVVGQLGVTFDGVGQDLGNEIHITFPDEFMFHDPTPTTTAVWWAGGPQRRVGDVRMIRDDLTLQQPQTTTVVGQKVKMIWADGFTIRPSESGTIAIQVYNLRSPNHCEPKEYHISFHRCEDTFLFDDRRFPRRKCSEALYELKSTPTSGVPADCTACNACVWLYDGPAGAVFRCNQDDKVFLRQGAATAPYFGFHVGDVQPDGSCTAVS